MPTVIIAFSVALLLSVITTPIAREVARYFRIVDNPDGFRKVHKKVTPLAGGYSVLVSFICPILFLAFFKRKESLDLFGQQNLKIMTLLAGATVSLLMGGLDDKWDLRPRHKIIFQFIAALFAYFGDIRIEQVALPFTDAETLQLGVFSFPVTLFWFLGCMNAINLLDGLDGLAAGIGLFAIVTIGLVGYTIGGHELEVFLCASLAGAILGFLVFNFNPASVFLGDGGSMLIGYLVAGLAIVSSTKAQATVALIIPFIALGLPIFDTLLAIIRRWSKRLPISAADHKHLHHVLIGSGLSHRTAVLVLYSICVCLGAVALLLSADRDEIAFGFLTCFAILAFVCIRAFNILDFDDVRHRVLSDMYERKRNTKATVAVEKAIGMLGGTVDYQGMWGVIGNAFEALELDHAGVEITFDGKKHVFTWKSEHSSQDKMTGTTICKRSGHHTDEWSMTLHLFKHDMLFGKLYVNKKSNYMPMRDICNLINRVRHALASTILRLENSDEKTEEKESSMETSTVQVTS